MAARIWRCRPILLLLVLLLSAFLAYPLLTRERTLSRSWSEPVIVEATGSDFQWLFRYPGADGDLGTPDDIRSSQLLMLPPGVEVTLLLKSEDYIYIITLPSYGLREMAAPGLTHKLVFHTTKAEEFDLLVDPLCGFRFYHDELMGHVSIAPRTDYSAWFGPSSSSDGRLSR